MKDIKLEDNDYVADYQEGLILIVHSIQKIIWDCHISYPLWLQNTPLKQIIILIFVKLIPTYITKSYKHEENIYPFICRVNYFIRAS